MRALKEVHCCPGSLTAIVFINEELRDQNLWQCSNGVNKGCPERNINRSNLKGIARA